MAVADMRSVTEEGAEATPAITTRSILLRIVCSCSGSPEKERESVYGEKGGKHARINEDAGNDHTREGGDSGGRGVGIGLQDMAR